MRARLLLIPFIFSLPAHAQDAPSQAPANPPGQAESAPVRDLSQLPMDGGWTYGELLDKAATGDFRANMLAGEYWMGLYYLNRGDLPLACLEHMQHFFRDAATASGHPAPRLMMTDPYGIFGIFKAQTMQPEHAEWLEACRKLAGKGDMDAVTALYTVTDLPEAELRRYLAPLEKKAASGDQDALAQLAFIKVDWLKEDPAAVLDSLMKHRKNAKPVLLARMGELAHFLGKTASPDHPRRKEWQELAFETLSKAAEAGHAAAIAMLPTLPEEIRGGLKHEYLTELLERGDLPTMLALISRGASGTLKLESGQVKRICDKARKLGSNNAYAWYAQWISEQKPPQEQELRKAALDLLALHDERGMPFLKEPLTLPQKKLNQLPPYAKTHKELELASQLGDADSSVQLGELWKEELANTMDSVGKAHEARENMRTWYKQAAEEGHPLAKLRLAQMEDPELMDRPAMEPAKTLLNDCLAKAATGDFITLRGISEYVTPEQWEDLTAVLRKKAQEGDARSQADLAYLMLFSYRSEESGYPEALAWARLSAGQGDPCGMYVLGRALIYEFGLEKRMAEGDSWMFRGALKGHVDAADMWSSNNENLQPYSAMMHGLAARGHIPSLLFLANQAAYPQNMEEAAAQDSSSSPYQQVKLTLNGTDENTPPWLKKPGAKNKAEDTLTDAGAVPPWMTPSGKERQAPAPQAINPEAVKLWEQAVELGSLTALDELANYYETVAGNIKDPAERQQLLASAMTAATALVKKEDVRGLKRLARYYEQGIGVQPNKELHKDYVLKAAETRDPEALVEKARLLIKGEDMEPDPKAALDILTRLEQNQTHAVPGMYFLLGYLHEEGLGIPQDTALAYQFYIKGAEQDDAKSMNNLGSMYERGTGVAKDLAEAQKWYEQAAELGNEDARANVERVKEKIKKKGK
ncbi:hypothetical protein ABGM91_12095 [Akkermansia muciniphila]|uniref:tetratricopeptide repeat protein n=1 Tax=Akkermansia muciniphila TaxID=239935 RepID=UPI0033BBACD9